MKATIFAQREQVENAETGRRELPAAREVQLITGETVVLYALDTGEMPLADTNQITSVRAGLVLNSTAVRLGEHGTVRELAESELYHWTDANEFDRFQYTRPVRINNRRYAVHLRVENTKVGMEQVVVYTDTGAGTARVDRLWRAIPDIRIDQGSSMLEMTAAYLLSEETM